MDVLRSASNYKYLNANRSEEPEIRKLSKSFEQMSNASTNKDIKELLKRVTQAPKALEEILTSSLPFLLLPNQRKTNKTPKKVQATNRTSGGGGGGDNKSTLHRMNTDKSKVTKTINNKRNVTNTTTTSTKKTTATAAIVSENKMITTKQIKIQEPNKKAVVNKAGTKSGQTALLHVNNKAMEKEESYNVLSTELFDVLCANDEKKESLAIRNSTLFTAVEKSHLRVYKFNPIEVDLILLQKLMKIDKELAKSLVDKIMDNECYRDVQFEKSKSFILRQKKAKNEKNTKTVNKEILANQLYDILLTRIVLNENRATHILFSALSKLSIRKLLPMKIKRKPTNKGKKNTAAAAVAAIATESGTSHEQIK